MHRFQCAYRALLLLVRLILDRLRSKFSGSGMDCPNEPAGRAILDWCHNQPSVGDSRAVSRVFVHLPAQ
jgi:hypothetical protein